MEEVSVLAADYRRKEPRAVNRPGSLSHARTANRPKHGGLFDAAMRGRVRHV